MRSLRFVTYNQAGDHYFQRGDGLVRIPKEVMRDGEAHRVWLELHMPGYDPVWDYHWHLRFKRIKAERFIESLTNEQRQAILEEANEAT